MTSLRRPRPAPLPARPHSRLPRGWLATLAPAALVLAGLSGCTASTEKVAGMAAQAQQLLDAGQPIQARELVQQALKMRDDLPGVYLVEAHVALALGDRGGAYQAYYNVLALEASNAEALLGVAQTGLGTGHLDEADKAADRILILDPNQTDAMLVKGIIKMVRNDLDASLVFANRMIAAKPDTVAGVVLKSRLMALQGDRPGALALLQGAIGRTGQTLEMTMSLAELQRTGGDGNGFLAALRRIREQAPRSRDYRFDLVDTLYRLGRVDEARTEASSLLYEPITGADELARFPRLWNAYDRQALTTEQFAHAAKDAPVEARLMLGRYLIASGRGAAAAVLLRPVATGWSSEVQGLYARALEAAGQTQAARDAADRLLAPGLDHDNGDALLVRAHAALAKNDPATAIVDLQRVVRNYPAWEEGYIDLARAYAASGRRENVRRVFEDGRKALPQSLPLARAYIAALTSSGDGAHAVDVSRRLALDSPSLAAAWALYVDACAKAGDAGCRSEAAEGAARTRQRFGLDPVPGTPPPIALVGRLG